MCRAASCLVQTERNDPADKSSRIEQWNRGLAAELLVVERTWYALLERKVVVSSLGVFVLSVGLCSVCDCRVLRDRSRSNAVLGRYRSMWFFLVQLLAAVLWIAECVLSA